MSTAVLVGHATLRGSAAARGLGDDFEQPNRPLVRPLARGWQQQQRCTRPGSTARSIRSWWEHPATHGPVLKGGISRGPPPMQATGITEGSGEGAGVGLDKEFLFIAIPVFFSLAVDPVASLVDTAFMGRLGAVQLGGTAVAMSVTNFCFKLLSMPLLFITTSAVARASVSDGQADLPGAVGTVLRLALWIGVAQTLALAVSCGPVLGAMGVSSGDAMRGPAADYLRARALGMPAAMLLLTAQGVYRGLGDTRPPLVATAACTLINVGLDYLFLFPLGLGARGVGIATVAGQAVAAGGLLVALRRRFPRWRAAGGGEGELKAGALVGRIALLVGRTLGPFVLFSLAASLAARAGAPIVAAHQISFQVWLGVGLLADSVAAASQTLLATSVAAGRAARARAVCARSLAYGLAVGGACWAALAATGPHIPALFTTDPEVAANVARLLPAIAATQPIVAAAFVGDGLLFGMEDYAFATFMMVASAGLGVAGLAATWRLLGPGHPGAILGVWASLTCLMAGRAAFSLGRWRAWAGPFAALRPQN